jgi:hypothetical protein
MPADEHFMTCLEHEEGYFPVSLFSGIRKQGNLEQGSVWHKERPTPDSHARTQRVANAFCYAIRHGEDFGIWKIMASERDSGLKKRIIDSLSRFHVPAEILIKRLNAIDNETETIAILQAIRNYDGDDLSANEVDQLKAILAKHRESSSLSIRELSKIIQINFESQVR